MPEFPISSARILLVSQIQGGQLPPLPPCPVRLWSFKLSIQDPGTHGNDHQSNRSRYISDEVFASSSESIDRVRLLDLARWPLLIKLQPTYISLRSASFTLTSRRPNIVVGKHNGKLD